MGKKTIRTVESVGAIGVHHLLYVPAGTARVVFGGRERLFPGGCLALFGKDMPRVLGAASPGCILTLGEGDMARLFALLPEGAPLWQRLREEGVVTATVPEERRALAAALVQDGGAGRGAPTGDAVLLGCALWLLSCFGTGGEGVAAVPPPIAAAMAYIRDNLSARLDLLSLAGLARMSKYHFCRRFKETTGQTVSEYILAARLALAKTMLRDEQVPIGEVGLRAGFSSMAYFSRVFREKTGKTPLAYRREGR